MCLGASFIAFLVLAQPYKKRSSRIVHLSLCIFALSFGLIICITLATAPRIPHEVKTTSLEMTELTVSSVKFVNENDEELHRNINDHNIEIVETTEDYSNVIVLSETTATVKWWIDVELSEGKYTIYLEPELYERYSMGNVIYKKHID